MPVIVLDTERLVLREFEAADAAFIVRLLNDPGWLRFIGDRHVRDEDSARRWIDTRLAAAYREHGFGLWAMQLRDGGALAGMCGLVRREGLPEIDLGYALLPEWRGRGLVREAAAACLRHAAGPLGRRRVLAITDPANERSIAVLHALGFVRADDIAYESDGRRSAVFAWAAATVHPDDPDLHRLFR